MGTWDVGPFDNDDASDWADELQGSDALTFLHATLSLDGGPVESGEGSVLVAAAAVLVALRGGPSEGFSQEILVWIEDNQTRDSSDLVPLAVRQLDRVLGSESELRQVWEENEELFPTWQARVQALRARLAA